MTNMLAVKGLNYSSLHSYDASVTPFICLFCALVKSINLAFFRVFFFQFSCVFRGPGWLAECEKVGLTPEEMELPEVLY